jgi:DNA modification methylase
MKPLIIHGDARHLPLEDASIDLIVTSPPYFGLRSYTDGGQHYDRQIGSEATPAEWLANLIDCTREWVRVLKPSGSLFVNLGDKYASTSAGSYWHTASLDGGRGRFPELHANQVLAPRLRPGLPDKCLLGMPWRYALAATDQLGLILRAEIIWAKPNGLPESVTDRVRRAHEQMFHFTLQPRYYAAVDEIREPAYAPHRSRPGILETDRDRRNGQFQVNAMFTGQRERVYNPLGKLPGSVWSIPSAPLTIPAHLGIDHFAAFPPALVRPIVLGWSPPGVCTACGEGRRPLAVSEEIPGPWSEGSICGKRNGLTSKGDITGLSYGMAGKRRFPQATTITGYACACGRPDAPSRPAVVLDPFGGTGTTALVASVHGRHGISVDLSADYCRLAAWRCHDPGERARAADVPKPPAVPDGQEPLFELG